MKDNIFFGDKTFYKKVLLIAAPIIIQNAVTNFVGLLDNIMIGLVGTDQMSGVSIVNQLLLVFNLSIFGAISSAGIFGAQFFGKGDQEGVRHTFRFKLILCAIITLIGICILIGGSNTLISLYIHEGGSSGSQSQTLFFGKQYLFVMLIGLIPFAIEQCYSGTLRETGETLVPMKAGLTAVVVNFILNYILIFGKFGAPALGVVGAAMATIISRFVECTIIVSWTHRHSRKNIFIQGVYRTLRIPVSLMKQIMIKGVPLMVNEILWSAGMAALLQCYSRRGLAVVAGMNISSVINNLFNVAFIGIGTSVSILAGQLLGAGKFEEAKVTAYRIIVLSTIINMVLGVILIVAAPLFPGIYNTTDEVKGLATAFIRVIGCVLPIQACLHAMYFTIRSGGKTIITFLFDSAYLWVIAIPLAYFLSVHTTLSIILVFLICQLIDLVKVAVGALMLKKEIWLSNIVSEA